MNVSEITKSNKEWYLCKYRPSEMSARRSGSNNKPYEYGMVRYHSQYGDSFAIELTGPSFNGWKAEINQLPKDTFIVIGPVELLAEGDITIANKVKNIIEKLELPALENINSILPVETIDIEWLNSDVSMEEITSKISPQELRQNLIKYMMYASYVKKIIDMLVDIDSTTESVPEPSTSKFYDKSTTVGIDYTTVAMPSLGTYMSQFIDTGETSTLEAQRNEMLQAVIADTKQRLNYRWETDSIAKNDDISDLV